MQARDGLLRLTKQEAKAESTDRVAREIIRAEEEARELKTQRLRAARLAKEAADKSAPVASSGRKAKRKAR